MALDRRTVLVSGSAALTAAVAGCNEVKKLLGGPDPEVVDVQSNQGFSGALSGEVTISVLVANEGGSGDVRVEVVLQDSNGNTLDRIEKIVEIQENEQRRVDFRVEPPRGAERFEATAEIA